MLLIILSWYIWKCHIYIYIHMCVCVWLEWSSSGLRDVENPWLWHPKMAGFEAIRSLSCPFPKSRWCLRNEHDWTCSSELEYGFYNKEHIYAYILYSITMTKKRGKRFWAILVFPRCSVGGDKSVDLRTYPTIRTRSLGVGCDRAFSHPVPQVETKKRSHWMYQTNNTLW